MGDNNLSHKHLLNRIKEAAYQSAVGKEKVSLLSVTEEKRLAEAYQVGAARVQRLAMEAEILPARYMRNFGTMGFEGQLALLNARVGIVGSGGLGGTVVELLVRMGVGHLVVVDFDQFEDNNLNRQLLCTETNLGESKTKAAWERAAQLNSAVTVTPIENKLSPDNGRDFFGSCDMLVDALDNMSARFALQDLARKTLGLPLVHGAIGGFTGQVTTIFPEDRGLETIYGSLYQKWQEKQASREQTQADGAAEESEVPDKLAEVELGNPAGTPTLTAAWQVQEVVKCLTGQGELLRHRLLYLDSFSGLVEVIEY